MTGNVVTKPYCYHYKKGKCRHGKLGNKIVNGRKCQFRHPLKCLKFCRFGWDKRQGGCDGSCGFFHPSLCRASINFSQCSDPDCTLQHLLGTVRSYQRPYPPPPLMAPRARGNGYQPPRYTSNAAIGGREAQPNGLLGQAPPQIYRRNEHFKYNQEEFPPLPTLPPQPAPQDEKIKEMSAAIKQMQSCLEFLMKSSQNSNRIQQMPATNPTFTEQFKPHPPPLMSINPFARIGAKK